jgi:hypothetical protein
MPLACFVIRFMVEAKKAFSLLQLVYIPTVSVSRSVSPSGLHLVFGWMLIPWFHVFLNLSLLYWRQEVRQYIRFKNHPVLQRDIVREEETSPIKFTV